MENDSKVFIPQVGCEITVCTKYGTGFLALKVEEGGETKCWIDLDGGRQIVIDEHEMEVIS